VDMTFKETGEGGEVSPVAEQQPHRVVTAQGHFDIDENGHIVESIVKGSNPAAQIMWAAIKQKRKDGVPLDVEEIVFLQAITPEVQSFHKPQQIQKKRGT